MQQYLSPAQGQSERVLKVCQVPKVGMLILCSRQCFSYTTGLQPNRTDQPIAIVQYIQHCIYPPPHSISSRPDLTHQTRYSCSWSLPGHLSEPSTAHASSHEASAKFNIARPFVLETSGSSSPSSIRKLPE